MGDTFIDESTIQQLFDRGYVDKSTLDRLLQSPPTSDGVPSAIDSLAAETADPNASGDLISRLKPYLIRQESGGNDQAISSAGATGLMQVMPATGAEIAGKLGMDKYDLKNREDNERIGTQYLTDMLEKFNGDPELALAAYNAGPNRVAKLLKETGGTTFEDIKSRLPEETRGYVKNIGAMFQKGEGVSFSALKNDVANKEASPPPQMAAAAPQEPSLLSRVGEALIPSAQAEEPTPQLPPADGNAPLPTEKPEVPLDEPQQATIDAANQAAQAGDPQATLDNLALGSANAPTKQALDNAFAMQALGKQADAEALVSGAEKQAKEFAARAQETANIGVDFAAKQQKAQEASAEDMARFRQKVIDFGSATIDPNRVFKNQSTFATIMLGISAAMQAIAGDTNSGLKIINDAITRDIDAQKALIEIKGKDIANEATLMRANQDQIKSIADAETITRAQMLARSQATIEQILANTKSEQAKANLTSVYGQLEQQKLELEQKFDAQRRKQNSLAALEDATNEGYTKSQQAFKDFADQDPKLRDKLVLLDGKPVGFALDKDAREAFNNFAEIRSAINTDVARLKELYKDNGTPVAPWSTDKWQEMNTLVNNLRNYVLRINAKGLARFAKLEGQSIEADLPIDLFSSSTFKSAGQSLKRGVWADVVPGILDRFEKKYNRQFLDAMANAVPNRTPEFDKYLMQQRSATGLDPDVKKVR